MRASCGRNSAVMTRRFAFTLLIAHALIPQRREQPCVIPHEAEILTNIGVLEENRTAPISAFDGSVQAVPFVGPSQRRGWSLLLVSLDRFFFEPDPPQQRKDAAQNAALMAAGRYQVPASVHRQCTKQKPFRCGLTRKRDGRRSKRRDGTEHDRRFGRQAAVDPQGSTKHARDAVNEFAARRTDHRRIAECCYCRGQRSVLLPRSVILNSA